ncbi:MAG: hypothetical protein KDJ90_17950, partial [Nitratireductor sp.]|nr:hypothetical protein [Nitratireductor sp.]
MLASGRRPCSPLVAGSYAATVREAMRAADWRLHLPRLRLEGWYGSWVTGLAGNMLTLNSLSAVAEGVRLPRYE